MRCCEVKDFALDDLMKTEIPTEHSVPSGSWLAHFEDFFHEMASRFEVYLLEILYY